MVDDRNEALRIAADLKHTLEMRRKMEDRIQDKNRRGVSPTNQDLERLRRYTAKAITLTDTLTSRVLARGTDIPEPRTDLTTVLPRRHVSVNSARSAKRKFRITRDAIKDALEQHYLGAVEIANFLGAPADDVLRLLIALESEKRVFRMYRGAYCWVPDPGTYSPTELVVKLFIGGHGYHSDGIAAGGVHLTHNEDERYAVIKCIENARDGVRKSHDVWRDHKRPENYWIDIGANGEEIPPPAEFDGRLRR